MTTPETDTKKQRLRKVELTFRRSPGRHVFSGLLRLITFHVDVEGRTVSAFDTINEPLQDQTFDELIYRVHDMLRYADDASVTIICQSPDGNPDKDRVHDLDDKFRDVLRNDLAKALELFRPVEVVVKL